ncbi:MAG: chromosomal replication initiator protein DnaA [Desulfotalea sp.]
MLWRKTIDVLKEILPGDVHSLWISPLKYLRHEHETIFLTGPDRYFTAFVEQNYKKDILQSLARVDSSIINISFEEPRRASEVVSGLQPQPTKKKASSRPAMKQMRLPSVPENNSSVRSLHPRYTFDEFMVGQSNILAETACRSISVNDDAVGPCLYINSGTGLGKSHLTHAVAHQVMNISPMTRMHYLTAQQFSAEMVCGIKSNNMEVFKKKYHDNCDILLVEDIHTLKGKKKTQEELNEVLDTLIKSGKRVILTANTAPRDLSGIDGELCSRMSAGLITSIQDPDVKTRISIASRKAAGQNIHLDEDMATYLGENVCGDVRQIESVVASITARARLMGGQVDMSTIKEVVASIIGSRQLLSSPLIRDLIADQFRVSVDDLQSKSRKRIITLPRQIAMFLSRKYTDDSLSEIGRLYKRDHSTVLHSVKVITEKSRRDTSLKAHVNLLSDKVQQI